MSNHGERTEPTFGKSNHGKSVTMVKFSPYPERERGQGSLLERAQSVAGSSNPGLPWVAVMCECTYMYPNTLQTMANYKSVCINVCIQVVPTVRREGPELGKS